MGIQGLLKALKGVVGRRIHIKEFAGKRVGVDISCWMHAGAYQFGRQLCSGEISQDYIDYCLKKIQIIQENKVKVLVVFDGAKLPMKQNTFVKRNKIVEENLNEANELWEKGEFGKANLKYGKSVLITFPFVREMIKKLNKMGVEYLVAPYETDAQLAYLSKKNLIDYVITEDSDLIAYGVQNLIFKFDYDGEGVLVERSQIYKYRKYLSLPKDLTDDLILKICVFSGCDYLPSIKGVGYQMSRKLFCKHRTISAVLKALKQSKLKCSNNIPAGYKEAFKLAFLCFKLQIVFCPILNECTHLNDMQEITKKYKREMGDNDLSYIGKIMEPKIAIGISKGEIEPTTYEDMRNIIPMDKIVVTKDNKQEKPVEIVKSEDVLLDLLEEANDDTIWNELWDLGDEEKHNFCEPEGDIVNKEDNKNTNLSNITTIIAKGLEEIRDGMCKINYKNNGKRSYEEVFKGELVQMERKRLKLDEEQGQYSKQLINQ